jgi:hypothetical protein
MITSIHYRDGRSHLAVLMSLTPGSMRLALPGGDDAAIFTRRRGQWFSEANEPVEIVFNAADPLEQDYCLLRQDLAAVEAGLGLVAESAALPTPSIQ